MSAHRFRISVTSALLLAAVASLGVAQCDGAWQPGFDGAWWGDHIKASIVFDDGTGPHLYVAAYSLGVAGVVPPGKVAKWNGSAWIVVGGWANVSAFAIWDDGAGPALYAAGNFELPIVPGVRKLVGSAWVPFGNNAFAVFSALTSLTVYDPDGAGPSLSTLYVGGSFGVKQYWAGVWSTIGSGTTNALCVYDVDGPGPVTPLLIAGGGFTGIPFGLSDAIAGWNGAGWVPLGIGIQSNFTGPLIAGVVYTVGAFDLGNGPVLVAGGRFTHAGGLPMANLAQWNGAAWSPLGNFVGPPPTFPHVKALAMFDDGSGPKLHVGGSFATAGGVPAKNIARLDPSSWNEVGGGVVSGFTPYVSTLTVFDLDGAGFLPPILVVGGTFMVAGTTAADAVAGWTGAAWFPFGTSTSMTGEVFAFAVYDHGTGPSLYAGGTFIVAGGVITNGIARFDGVGWVPVGPGMNGGVYALCVHDDGAGPQLYAGGTFTAAPGQPGNGIAKWNGTSWSAVGGGVSGTSASVCALLSFDDGTGSSLYAGGSFANAGGTAVSNIARWDGQAWFDMGGGVSNPYPLDPEFPPGIVLALESFDPDGPGPSPVGVVAGGDFVSAGSVTTPNVAFWNGVAWSALGTGLPDPASYFSGTVRDLLAADIGGVHALYAAGRFSFWSLQGPVDGIARWIVGPDWNDVGGVLVQAGPDPYAYALASFEDGSGPALAVGGRFWTAGGVTTYRLATWNGSSWASLGSGISLVSVNALIGLPFPNGLIIGGNFTHAGGLPSVNVAWWKPGLQVLQFTQTGGPGSGCFIHNSNLQPGTEYWDIFSLDPCATLGSGPYLGLCATDASFLISQFLSPLGTVPFHFTAPGPSASFGPFLLPPGLVVEAITFTLGPGPICVSPAARLVVQ